MRVAKKPLKTKNTTRTRTKRRRTPPTRPPRKRRRQVALSRKTKRPLNREVSEG